MPLLNFFGSKDGLVHISQLAKTRVNKTTDVVKEGDRVKVKVLGYDDRGRVKLSMRFVDQQTGAVEFSGGGAGGNLRIAIELHGEVDRRLASSGFSRFAQGAKSLRRAAQAERVSQA